ncbi:MAG: hypothetical protein HY671_11190 [Chloroflexi bacterium]|nr:hypothetical protein [Chloroflexota bacterium]
MNKTPLWATPERQAQLVKLWEQHGNRCLQGHLNCPDMGHYLRQTQKLEIAAREVTLVCEEGPAKGVEFRTFGVKRFIVPTEEWIGGVYFLKEEDAIAYWKAEDRDRRAFLHRKEQRQLHALPDITHRGQFDSIARDEFMMKRPLWEIAAYGVNPLTLEKVARVIIHGTHETLWVDLSGLKKPSKNQKHKYARYGEGEAPRTIREQIEDRVSQAVSRYLNQ